MSEYKKMDKKVKAKWLKALRSRKYKQTTLALHDSQGHCCLGVLCDIVEPDKWANDEVDGYKVHDPKAYRSDSGDSTDLPSDKLCKKVGLDLEVLDQLTRMNDTEGKKFYQIARWIERNL
jgi:hypothetical protein